MTAERDDQLDRLLRRVHARDADARSADACPDAATVAAFADRTLTAAERHRVESHAADCARCTAILGSMVTMEHAPYVIPWWNRWRTVGWAVPAAAAAASFTLWVLVRAPDDVPQQQSPAATGQSAPAEAPPARFEAPAARGGRKSEADTAASSANTDAFEARAVEKRKAEIPGRGVLQRERSRLQESAAARATAPPAAESPAVLAPAAPTLARDALVDQKRAVVFAPVEITSPDPKVRWRITGSTVERTTDGGATWTAQEAGATSQLMGGSSPSPVVCWIVGLRGTVLITTDGGVWRRITTLADVDLSRVTATDALNAVVTGLDGRSYRTTDGGRTWLVQENPPASF